MDYLKILNQNEKREILNKLNSHFGINKIKGILAKKREGRLFLFEENFDVKQIKTLERIIPIERIGIYFAKIIKDEIRLSVEGTYLFKDQINKNIFQLTEQQSEQWMLGQELNIQTGKKGFLVMKYKNDFLGCGKASTEKISNDLPKSRRLKNQNVK
jgi:NOL1/NOP2/fmu family ribosome biogenesis protein